MKVTSVFLMLAAAFSVAQGAQLDQGSNEVADIVARTDQGQQQHGGPAGAINGGGQGGGQGGGSGNGGGEGGSGSSSGGGGGGGSSSSENSDDNEGR